MAIWESHTKRVKTAAGICCEGITTRLLPSTTVKKLSDLEETANAILFQIEEESLRIDLRRSGQKAA